ncbi:glycine zipper 2TM domain-containing protein [bacterium]|nr:glycine zipper 2TM domain-containing protein [bacterium]
MKYLIPAAVAFVMTSTAVFANNKIETTVVSMQESYRTVVKETPVQSCKNVEVPIYETRNVGKASTGDTLLGAVIGGAIGNQFGSGSGKDAATVLGAILGADSVNKKGGRQETVIVGYRQQQQCTTVYQNKETEVRGRNLVTFESNDGQRFTFKTREWYKRGTIVWLNVSQ